MESKQSWNDRISFDGIEFETERIERGYAERAGFSALYAVNGLPQCFEDSLVRAAQVCEVPHTWRVQECQSEAEVDEDILARGKAALERDQRELNASIICYLRSEPSGLEPSGFEFVAAGAIRDKLSRSFHSPEYPVVSRAVVAPLHRGKGLGSLIVEHRMSAAMRSFYGVPAKAIHFATESKKILQSIKRVEEREGVSFVYIGDEQYTADDGTHTVHDFLCFLPWFIQEIEKACDEISTKTNSEELARKFKAALGQFMRYGIEAVRGTDLEALFTTLKEALSEAERSKVKVPITMLEEIFIVKQAIGACDP